MGTTWRQLLQHACYFFSLTRWFTVSKKWGWHAKAWHRVRWISLVSHRQDAGRAMLLGWSTRRTRRSVAVPLPFCLSLQQYFCFGLMLTQSLMQFPGKIFQVYSHDGPQVFIPPNIMDEVRRLPDNILSMTAAYKDVSWVLSEGRERESADWMKVLCKWSHWPRPRPGQSNRHDMDQGKSGPAPWWVNRSKVCGFCWN